MKAIQISSTGAPDVLTMVEIPIPEPAQGEALIEIARSGVNFIDIYYREGRYPAHLPLVLGQEAAGTVVGLGEGVEHFKVGDRVAWRGGFGTYAEYAAVSSGKLVAIPEGITFDQAAAVMTQGLTAHYLTHSAYPIKSGDNVLIHAGAGGTGRLVIQMAKMRGAYVLTTVSSEKKAEIAREAGADEVIMYTEESFNKRARVVTSDKGLAVVYDSVGRSTFEESLTCLSRRGVLVLYGASSGPVPAFDLFRLAQAGSLYVTRPVLNDYVATPSELNDRARDIFHWIHQGRLALRITHTFSLSEARIAHKALQSRESSGKLLLRT